MKTFGKAVVVMAVILTVTACAPAMMLLGRGPKRPAESEFGTGPRPSAQGRYVATLQPEQPLRVRKLQAMQVTITDAVGQPVDGATIAIGGGMPQHGHGLPTRPRVTKALGGGVYQIEGVRFNMGGWWELELAVDGTAGTDTVTFNLAL